jgi:myo-inositol 2-dehydrogenase / D-chiro-inositol 1-dehydrogenase
MDAERRGEHFVQVGFVMRHGPMFSTLRRWITEDRMGSPLDVRVSVFDEVLDPEGNSAHYQRIMATLGHGAPCIHDDAHTMDHLRYLLDDRVVRMASWGRTTRPEIGWFLPVFPPGEWSIVGPAGIAWFDQGTGHVTLNSEFGAEVVTLSADDDWFTSCFRYQLKTFIAAIQSRIPPRPGSADGMASLALSKEFELGMERPFVAREVAYP